MMTVPDPHQASDPSPREAGTPPPHAWRTLGLFLVTMVAGVVAVGIVGDVASTLLADTPFSRLSFQIFLASAPFAAVLLLSAFLAAERGRRSASLGLVRPSLRPRAWAVMLLGTGVPFAVGMLLASLLRGPMSSAPSLHKWDTVTPLEGVALVLFIAIGPALSEEIFFRGLMQRRLAAACSPALAIGVSAALFALMHLDPATAVFAFVMGVWLGYIAWRSGSIWPGIVIHASVNGLSNTGQIVVQQTSPDHRLIALGLAAFGVFSLVCFVGALRLLGRPISNGANTPNTGPKPA